MLPDPFDTRFLDKLLSHTSSERRRFPRREVAGPALLVPLSEEGLDHRRARPAETYDLSRGGVALRLEEPTIGPRWAVVFEAPDKPMAIEVSLRGLRRNPDGGFRLGCQFIDRVESAA